MDSLEFRTLFYRRKTLSGKLAQADNCVCRMGGIIFLGEGYRISPNNAYACNISVYKLCDMQGSIKEGRGG